MDDRRPNPEELLKTIKKEESTSGRLHIFFGMCPGVGKTFEMLKAAHDQKKMNRDVVIGVVETHGRKETEAMVTGLETIPKISREYKGSILQEMDLDAILKRKPEIVLVDELAHTNAPGSRHSKRYQDVEELLAAGIHVFTTINVQHIESRSDLVSQITGSHIRETVPDSFLQRAQQIELLDLTPEDLLKRLKEGKVYLGERAEKASENFFKIENLTALRELALRFTAEKVDHQLRDQMSIKQILGPWNTNERLLVAISHSPYSARLIRAGRRMAFNLEAPWIVLHIDQGLPLSEEDQSTLTKNINLARELGAEIVATVDTDLSSAIKRVCEERNVTQVVMGRPDRRFLKDIFAKGTLLDRLVRETSKIDVHVVRQERKPKYIGFHLELPKFSTGFSAYWYTLWFLIAVSFASYAALPWIGYRSVGFVFLLSVLVISSFASKGPIFFAAILSAFVWNFFFIPPLYTFAITEPEDIMMCLAYFIVASVAGYLANRIRKQEADLISREFRSSVLYEFGKQISDAKDSVQIARRAQEAIERLYESSVGIFISSKSEELDTNSLNFMEEKIDDKVSALANWSYKNKKKAGWSTETLSSNRCLSLPLIGKTKTVGVLLFFPKKMSQLNLEQENFLETITNNVALALERNLLENDAKDSLILRESEKLHQTLLNSVSHELKTPITSIVGSSTALLDKSTLSNDGARENILKGLISSSQRLNRVVENLLDMSRISSGVLQIRKEIFELNDFIDSFLNRNKELYHLHKIKFQETSDIYIEGDDRLLEHVLLNLVGNAASYSPKDSLITILLTPKENFVELSIMDEGSGISEDKLDSIFNAFYRIPGTPAGGTGLGLTISKSIVEAHGGQIIALNRKDRSGAIFKITLKTVSIQLDGQL